MSELAPAFVRIVTDETAAPRLKTVVEQYLLKPEREGAPPPIVSLVRIGFGVISDFALDACERGSPCGPGGNPCNDASPPAPIVANRMCLLRRLLATFVHEGRGLEALQLVDPVVYSVLAYLDGRPPVAGAKHPEVAGLFARACSSPGLCKPDATLDLFSALLAYFRPPRGKDALNAINALWNNPALSGPDGFITHLNVENQLGEEGYVLLLKFLLSAVLQMKADATWFDNLDGVLTQYVYPAIDDSKQPGLRAQIDQVRAVLRDALDPRRPEPVLKPLQKVVYCINQIDKNGDLLRMLYRLAFEAKAVGMRDLLKAAEGMFAIDEKGVVVETVRALVEAIRRDDQGVAAALEVCAVALDTAPDATGASNAGHVVEVMADLFQGGAVGEMLCVADTLLYGCAGGGTQPACTPRTRQP